MEPFSYFGHNWSRLSYIEMKLLDFVQGKEGYKSVREGHYPFLLEFVRKFKIMVFKDLGPVQ
jgi:hypothetical protein